MRYTLWWIQKKKTSISVKSSESIKLIKVQQQKIALNFKKQKNSLWKMAPFRVQKSLIHLCAVYGAFKCCRCAGGIKPNLALMLVQCNNVQSKDIIFNGECSCPFPSILTAWFCGQNWRIFIRTDVATPVSTYPSPPIISCFFVFWLFHTAYI